MKINVFASVAISTLVLGACQQEKPLNADGIEGKVKKETVSVTAKVTGRITELLVSEGDKVKKGQPIARIDIPEAEAKLLQAQGAYTSAKAQYQMTHNGATTNERKQANAAATAANDQYALAEKSFARIKNMYRDSLISAQQYDEMLTKYQSAKAQRMGTMARRDEVDGTVRAERIQMAYGDMLRAEGALKEVQSALREKVIIAAQDMAIESISLHEGELAPAGYAVATGYATGRTYLRFTVSEKEIGTFVKGKTYAVKLPYANKTIDAKLLTIRELANYASRTSSYPTYELGEATYELKLMPVDPAEQATLLTNQTVMLTAK